MEIIIIGTSYLWILSTWRCWRKCGSPSGDTVVRLRNREGSIPAQYKSQQSETQFYRMTDLHAEPFNRLTYSYGPHTLFVSYCISDSACSKNYKAKGSICVSIFDQWLLWSGSKPAVQTWSRGCQALVRKWTRWQQETTSHGDVEDMELSDTTQVTGDH